MEIYEHPSDILQNTKEIPQCGKDSNSNLDYLGNDWTSDSHKTWHDYRMG